MRKDTSYMRPSDEKLKERLTEIQYEIMVNSATEQPFTSEHLNNEQEGIYVDVVTGEPLFTTFDQFESSCGWPSFTRPVLKESIKVREDLSHGMVRVEVRSNAGDFHLGHVFEDGPKEEGGLRYCINGQAIRFVPIEDMEAEGYDYMMPYMREKEREKNR